MSSRCGVRHVTEGVRIGRDQLATFGHQGLIDLIYCADYGNITEFSFFDSSRDTS